MRKIFSILVLSVLCCGTASADVWKWVDANGKTHFVDSMKSIYTWRDESGRVFYSDRKEHELAVLVQLVWHSTGSLADMSPAKEEDGAGSGASEGESEKMRLAREADMAHRCKRAQEIYDSYVNAPKLYKNNADGKKEYLSKKEAQRTIDETKIKVDELCQ